MEGRRFIESIIRLTRYPIVWPLMKRRLSSLEPLNVLIGPNASGKSNLIEVRCRYCTPPQVICRCRFEKAAECGNGCGRVMIAPTVRALKLRYVTCPTLHSLDMSIKYLLEFTNAGGWFFLLDEVIRSESPTKTKDSRHYSYNLFTGMPLIEEISTEGEINSKKEIKREDLRPNQSILSQLRDIGFNLVLSYLANSFEGMRFYREWNLVVSRLLGFRKEQIHSRTFFWRMHPI